MQRLDEDEEWEVRTSCCCCLLRVLRCPVEDAGSWKAPGDDGHRNLTVPVAHLKSLAQAILHEKARAESQREAEALIAAAESERPRHAERKSQPVKGSLYACLCVFFCPQLNG